MGDKKQHGKGIREAACRELQLYENEAASGILEVWEPNWMSGFTGRCPQMNSDDGESSSENPPPRGRQMWERQFIPIVANIPEWLDMVVNMDELDINPPGGPKFKPQDDSQSESSCRVEEPAFSLRGQIAAHQEQTPAAGSRKI